MQKYQQKKIKGFSSHRVLPLTSKIVDACEGACGSTRKNEEREIEKQNTGRRRAEEKKRKEKGKKRKDKKKMERKRIICESIEDKEGERKTRKKKRRRSGKKNRENILRTYFDIKWI